MMSYHDWNALLLGRRNALCAEAMGWRYGAVAGRDICDRWLDRDGQRIVVDGRELLTWSPCDNRNDTTRMVEAVIRSGKRGLLEAALEALGYTRAESLAAPADYIAWACCEALTATDDR